MTITKRKIKKSYLCSVVLLILFSLLTLLLTKVDVATIGPRNSSVGFSSINGAVHQFLGIHMSLYTITDWASIIALIIAFGFAILGLVQLIKRKSILKVDSNILILGIFYIIVIGTYLFFEFYTINYRPVLIKGYLEGSYPSSTTMLVMCIMPTAIMEFKRLIRNATLSKVLCTLSGVFTVLIVIGRMVSGVHWFTDILGGIIISTALVMLYYSTNKLIVFKCSQHSLGDQRDTTLDCQQQS